MAKLIGVAGNYTAMQGSAKLEEMHARLCFGEILSHAREKFSAAVVSQRTSRDVSIAEKEGIVAAIIGKAFVDDKGSATANYILESYLKEDMRTLMRRLNGTFVLCIHDSERSRTLIANDRFGMLPIYYVRTRQGMGFASEMKALLPLDFDRKIDWRYWKEYFSYGFCLGDKTPFATVKSLSNATILEFSHGDIFMERYWDYDEIKIEKSRGIDEIVKKGVDILKKIFARHCHELSNCSVLLSGGYDSRAMLGSIKHFTNLDVNAYTIAKSYTVRQPATGDMDSNYGQLVCDRLHVEYEIMGNTPRIYEDYFIRTVLTLDGTGSEHIWLLPLIEKIDDLSPKFDGIMGDILMRAGWLSIRELARPWKSTERLSKNLHKQMVGESGFDNAAILNFFGKQGRSRLEPDHSSVREELESVSQNPYRIKSFHAKNRTKNTIALCSSNITRRKFDVVTPFCDNEFADFALTIHPQVKVNRNIYKRIIDEAFPELSDIPTTNDPENINDHIRMMMLEADLHYVVYILSFLKNKLKGIIARAFPLSGRTRLSGNPRDVSYLLKLAESIRMPPQVDKQSLLAEARRLAKMDLDPSNFLEPILVFCIWYRAFIRDDEKLWGAMHK